MKNEKTLAEQASGLHYNSAEAAEILDNGEWNGLWPVVDKFGILTGEIIDSQPGYYNVDDMAMIHRSNVTPDMMSDVMGYANTLTEEATK